MNISGLCFCFILYKKKTPSYSYKLKMCAHIVTTSDANRTRSLADDVTAIVSSSWHLMFGTFALHSQVLMLILVPHLDRQISCAVPSLHVPSPSQTTLLMPLTHSHLPNIVLPSH
jgi:hypothetical protein